MFGKEHNKVCRDIESLSCSTTFNAANFGVIEYTDSRGRVQKAYEMTKDGFSFLVMGYTGEKAGQFKEIFINEFNKREMMLKSDDYILARSQEILHNRLQLAEKQLAQANERISLQDTQLKAQAPKVDYYDQTLQSVNTLTTTQVAKSIGMETHTLTKKLKECGIIFKQSGMWMLHAPYSKWKLHATRTSSYTRSDGTTGTSQYTVWTERGRRFIVALNDNGFNASKAIKAIQAA